MSSAPKRTYRRFGSGAVIDGEAVVLVSHLMKGPRAFEALCPIGTRASHIDVAVALMACARCCAR